MPTQCIIIFKLGRYRQRGGALMILLVIIVAGLAAALISSLSITALENARKKTNFDVMAQAKDALIGRAVNDSSIPGSLPCPDTNNDGSAELLSGNNCPSYIGRLPWITLGLPDLRDASGERLWYALSPAFRDDNSASPLNSNTKGTLVVYNADGVSLQTQPGYQRSCCNILAGQPHRFADPWHCCSTKQRGKLPGHCQQLEQFRRQRTLYCGRQIRNLQRPAPHHHHPKPDAPG